MLKSDADIIKKMRNINSIISNIESQDLISLGVKPYLADKLVRKFNK